MTERIWRTMRNRRHLLTATLCLPLLLVVACADTDAIQVPAEAKSLPSGLKYLDLKTGEGTEAKKGSAIKAHYTGMLQKNGKKFDSSVDRGTPLEIDIGVGQVIKGWDEGIVGMKVGGKRKLFIPYDLAYGENGRPPAIPRKADLVFEVELVDVATEITAPEGAKKTAGGVLYTDTTEGTGTEATAGKKVEVHYTGKLQKNGKKFDSSVDRGETFTFTLGQKEVIQGWDEGVAGMKEGGKRKLFIPSKLGYGDRGAGRSIPPGSDLYFEVELIKVR